jgi:hypothetical protein
LSFDKVAIKTRFRPEKSSEISSLEIGAPPNSAFFSCSSIYIIIIIIIIIYVNYVNRKMILTHMEYYNELTNFFQDISMLLLSVLNYSTSTTDLKKSYLLTCICLSRTKQSMEVEKLSVVLTRLKVHLGFAVRSDADPD